MISVVLMEPEHPANIGAVARAMANFDFDNLILINPKCNHLDPEAILRAKHSALKILKNARIENSSKLNGFDYLIGTSAIIGTDYNIPRSPLNPEIGARKIAEIKNKKVAILFGREGIGLKKNEIGLCDFMITVATSEKFKAMNISHAASIIFYELFKKIGKEKVSEHIITATKKGYSKNCLEKNYRKKFINKKRGLCHIGIFKKIIKINYFFLNIF